MDTLGYQALVHDRLVASGYTVRSAPPSALVGYLRDRPMGGAVDNSWMRAQIDALLPQPDALVGADPR